MKRLTALVRVNGSENIAELSDNIKLNLKSDGYADDNGHGNLKLSEKGQNEIERLSNIMGLTNRKPEDN
tara:strand:+ start:98 stop:304 length:207 start_codon:yes stop_codon:yes gene_type:complete